MSEALQENFVVTTGAVFRIALAATVALLGQDATVVLVDRNEATMSELMQKFATQAISRATHFLDVGSCNAMVHKTLQKVPISTSSAAMPVPISVATCREHAEAIDPMLQPISS